MADAVSLDVHSMLTPAPWIVRHASLLPAAARVLDVACGYGRHSRVFAEQGAQVTAVDRDAEAIASLTGLPGVAGECRDLERDAWPYAASSFDVIVVCNYLWRPTFADVVSCLRSGGVLLYETFMDGNERYGKPSRPDFLLRPNELLERTRDAFRVVAFEEGPEFDASGQPFAMKQKLAAVKR